VFFVISGFIMWTITAGGRRGRAFLWRRFTRVAPTYWLITLGLAGMALAGRCSAAGQRGWRHVLLSMAFIPHLDRLGLPFPVLPRLDAELRAVFYLLFSWPCLWRTGGASCGDLRCSGTASWACWSRHLPDGGQLMMAEFAGGLWRASWRQDGVLPGGWWGVCCWSAALAISRRPTRGARRRLLSAAAVGAASGDVGRGRWRWSGRRLAALAVAEAVATPPIRSTCAMCRRRRWSPRVGLTAPLALFIPAAIAPRWGRDAVPGVRRAAVAALAAAAAPSGGRWPRRRRTRPLPAAFEQSIGRRPPARLMTHGQDGAVRRRRPAPINQKEIRHVGFATARPAEPQGRVRR